MFHRHNKILPTQATQSFNVRVYGKTDNTSVLLATLFPFCYLIPYLVPACLNAETLLSTLERFTLPRNAMKK